MKNIEKKLILHIPHSSTKIPLKEGYLVSEDVLQEEILKLNDWYTDDLYYSEQQIMIISDFSRIFCDVERFSDDKMEIMSQFGMGVLFEKSDTGQIIRKIDSNLREKIMTGYYWPHHKSLSKAVELQLKLYGKALILDCHSFPNVPLLRSLNKESNRPDFNIGTDSFHTTEDLKNIAVNYFIDKGYTIGIDWPYSGTIIPMEYYQKKKMCDQLC